jgi:hypothetical protein
MVLVDHGDLSVGWHEDPDDPAKFRYWSGKEWTARAQTHTDASGVIFVGAQLRRSSAGSSVPGSFGIRSFFM